MAKIAQKFENYDWLFKHDFSSIFQWGPYWYEPCKMAANTYKMCGIRIGFQSLFFLSFALKTLEKMKKEK